jgi:hypothetical protein
MMFTRISATSLVLFSDLSTGDGVLYGIEIYPDRELSTPARIHHSEARKVRAHTSGRYEEATITRGRARSPGQIIEGTGPGLCWVRTSENIPTTHLGE